MKLVGFSGREVSTVYDGLRSLGDLGVSVIFGHARLCKAVTK